MYAYMMKTKLIRWEHPEKLTTSEDWKQELEDAMGRVLDEAINLVASPSASDWKIVSHDVAPVGNHLVISFLYRRWKEEGMI